MLSPSNTLFDTVMPRSPDIRIEIKAAIHHGGQLAIWGGPSDTEESVINAEIHGNRSAMEFIKRSGRKGRIKEDGSGSYRVPIKMTLFENGQVMEFFNSEILVTPLEDKKKYSKLIKPLVSANKRSTKALTKITNSIIAQQKDLPIQLQNMLAVVVQEGNKSVSLSAQFAAETLKFSTEPLIGSLALIEKSIIYERTRADKATALLTGMLEDREREREGNDVNTFVDMVIKLLEAAPTILPLIERAIEHFKK